MTPTESIDSSSAVRSLEAVIFTLLIKYYRAPQRDVPAESPLVILTES